MTALTPEELIEDVAVLLRIVDDDAVMSDYRGMARTVVPFVLEAAVNKAEELTSAAHLRLIAGEMTAQEERTAKAVAKAIVIGIRRLKHDI